jgi:peptidoglycan/LPS O-acetylase OafA/YrhL
LLIHCFPQAWIGDWWWTLFFAGYPLALTAAVVSWHVFEYPVLKLRNSFVIKHRPEGGLPTAITPSPITSEPKPAVKAAMTQV